MLLSHPSPKLHSVNVPRLRHRTSPFPLLDYPSLLILQRSSKRPFSFIRPLIPHSSVNPLHFSARSAQNDSISSPLTSPSIADVGESLSEVANPGEKLESRKNFLGAVSLIIGTAVGPGMLGLPSATIKAGPFPSTVAIILAWVYVISSIILVAELSFAAMEEEDVEEVSFTALASRALGPTFGSFVAVVYACLSFSLLIACVSGIGSLFSQQFHALNPFISFALFPSFVGIVVGVFPFRVIDFTNRLLCALMLFSISALLATGLSVGRRNLINSFLFVSWKPEAIMPSIPVTVLTLGFHVITPYVCKLLRHSVYGARKAILYGGFVPLAMVLSWNVVVLGLAGGGRDGFQGPIKLLLSVNSAALPAVRGFAFAALATSLIGYALSFPKQLLDTLRLVAQRLKLNEKKVAVPLSWEYDGALAMATAGEASSVEFSPHKHPDVLIDYDKKEDTYIIFVTLGVLIVPIFIAYFFQEAFAKALDFAGVYANCFLFGVLPPIMAWISRSRKRYSELLPGGNLVLAVLLCIAVILGVWH